MALTLHRFLESEDLTINAWIRHRRLEHCRVDLAHKGLEELPINLIGSNCGLRDSVLSGRVFRACYGLSPSAYGFGQRLTERA